MKLKQSQANNVAAASIHRMFEGAKLENKSNNAGVIVSDVKDGSPDRLWGYNQAI